MKRMSLVWTIFLLFSPPWSFSPDEVHAACRNPHVADGAPIFQNVAASGKVEIKWFGHSFFQITSSSGTRIITDPFGAMGFPMPDVSGDVVTIGREHGNHNNVALVQGSPVVLRGVKEGGQDWDAVNLTFRDVLIYNVPVHQRGIPDNLSMKGSGFVFEVDGLCIFHSGDVSEPFNEDQLQLIGHVDVLLQVIGGVYTIGPDGGRKVIQQLKPKIVIPMHYWYQQGVLERFLDGSYRARNVDSNTLTVSKDTLPPFTEIIVLKVRKEGDI